MITRNSARCNYCGVEVESKNRHDFAVHYCPTERKQDMKWEGNELVPNGNEITWNFAVDGGKDYLKRCGEGYTDTSTFTDD